MSSEGYVAEPDGRNVKSAERTLNILSYVSDQGSVGRSELLTELKLPRSSGHKLLSTMVSMSWLEHDPKTRRYALGLRAWQVGHQYAGHLDLANAAKQVMEELRDRTGETVQLARLDGIQCLYIAISESKHPMRLASSVGMNAHAHATGLGKAMLSTLPDSEVRSRFHSLVLPRLTANTVTSLDALLTKLAECRERGFALDEEEYVEGCRCISMVITSSGSDRPLTALSITTPTSRTGPGWPMDVRPELAAAVLTIQGKLRLH